MIQRKNRMALTLAALAAVTMALSGCSSATPPQDSDDPLSHWRENGITVGIAGEVPWSYVEGGELRGAEGEIVTVCANNLGIEKVTSEQTDFDGLLPGLNAGRWDVIAAGMSLNDDRLQIAIATQQMYGFGGKVLVAKGNPLGVHSWHDIAESGQELAMSSGSNYEQALRDMGVNVKVYPNFDTALSDLTAGRVQMVAQAELSLYDFVEKNPDSGFEIATPWDYEGISLSRPAMYFAQANVALRDAFNDCISDLKKDGTLAEILERNGFDPASITPPAPGEPAKK